MKPFLASLTIALTGVASAQAPKPNIIFVLVDDMGWGDLGIFYQNGRDFATHRSAPAFQTPGLDTMATEGMQLRRHYCPAPVCAPSRASLLLGVHQGHANVRDNQFDKPLENNHTLGTVLKQAGYATAMIGKYGLNGTGLTAQPAARGFDYFFGYREHGDAHLHYPKENGANVYDGTTDIAVNLDKCYSTDFITARAKKWIVDQHAAQASQPFFIYLAYTAPHARLDVPTQAYPAGKGINGGLQWIGTPGNMINTANGTINSWIHPNYESATYDDDKNPATAEIAWPAYAKRHATMIRRLDDGVSDIIQTLKDLNLDNNTLIVFTSDNGPHNESGSGGSYTYNPTFFDSFGPMDGIKRDSWEGGMREPAIVRWPGHIAAGGITTAASQFHDWMPTFAELAGVPAPARTDGVSLVPTLTNTGTQRASTIYLEYNYPSGTTPGYTEFEPSHRNAARNQEQVIHVDGYKGIRNNIAASSNDFLIYDTLADAKETTNLANSSPYFIALQQRMKDRVLQVRRPGGDVTRPYDTALVAPLVIANVVPGLDYKTYEGTFPWVPDFTTLTSAGSGSSSGIDLSIKPREENFGLLYTGYLQVPTDGTYTFYLNTDSRAFMRLHDASVIDADFGHAGGTEVSSSINLKAGRHPIRLGYVRGTGGTPSLSLEWSGPGIARQAVPDANFLHPGTSAPNAPVAHPDSSSSYNGNAVTIPLLANDTDDGSPGALFIANVSAPLHGTAVISGTSVIYTPAAGFYGDDAFSYTVGDGADTAGSDVRVAVYPEQDVVWLPLDESSGTSAGDRFGRAVGSLTGFPEAPWTIGKLGNALTFDGTDDRLTLGGYKGVTGTSARSITFWMKADATQTSGTRPTVVSWGAGNNGVTGARFDINLNHTSGYKLRTEFNNAGVNFSTSAHSDLRGTGWIHCAIIMPAGATVSQVKAYLDGTLATAEFEPAGSGSVSINTGNAYDVSIGRIVDTTGARTFGGLLDDVRIYPRELTAPEIASLANQTPRKGIQEAWFFRHTGKSIPLAGDWAADTDGDGYNARLEFALGGNPTAGHQGIAPVLNGTTEFIFNRRQEGISASSYVPEISNGLDFWSALTTFSVVNHPEMSDFDRVTVSLPVSDDLRKFVRLRLDPDTQLPQ